MGWTKFMPQFIAAEISSLLLSRLGLWMFVVDFEIMKVVWFCPINDTVVLLFLSPRVFTFISIVIY